MDRDRMLYFGASSYLFNTAGFVYHAAGALVFEITNDMVRGGGTREAWLQVPAQPQASLDVSLSLSGPSLNCPASQGG